MPSRLASSGERSSTAGPSVLTSPASGRTTPAATLRSVDFPAPLSPMTACTSPRSSVRSTPRSASTAPNDLRIPASCRTASPLLRGTRVETGFVGGVVQSLCREDADLRLEGARHALALEGVHGGPHRVGPVLARRDRHDRVQLAGLQQLQVLREGVERDRVDLVELAGGLERG